MRCALLTIAIVLCAIHPATDARADDSKSRQPIPKSRALKKLVQAYLDAKPADRKRMRDEWDRTLVPLDPKTLPKLRKELLKITSKHGPKIRKSGTNYFFEKKKSGKYIVQGKPGKALFIGLHGGGAGSGDAGAAAGAMGGGGWWWIFPEVLKKTEHGWTDSGTEEFVMDLIEAAKRTAKVDPNRVYITGHSMGGYGSWTLGAHHADVFAGAAPYAGAPTAYYRSPTDKTVTGIQDGVLPNFYNLPLHVYQSLDDLNVTPESNIFANKALQELKKRFPEGFNWKYVEVNGRGHAAPQEGYLPSQKWLASMPRVPRPKTFLWQPALPWKRHFYWLYWQSPELAALLEVRAKPNNHIEITWHEGSGASEGQSVLLGEPLVDLSKPVTVAVNGETLFEGVVQRTFSTLMMTLPRNDEHLLFDARVDL